MVPTPPMQSDGNPYIAPPLPPLASPDGTILVFAILNFFFGGMSLLWVITMGAVLGYGIFASGDTESELLTGVLGTLLLAVPGLVGTAVFVLAGLGLLKRRAWGYFFHLVGAVIVALSCVGLIYTSFAIYYAMRPEFSGAFFPPRVGFRLVP